MLNKINKKGSHVGVVLSFLLFITFIVFMYVLLDSRINQEKGKSGTLEYVKGTVIDLVSEELTIVSVVVSGTEPACVILGNFLSTMGIGNKVIARDDLGNLLATGFSGTDLQVNRNGKTFFRVYESNEFPVASTLSGCQLVSHTIGLLKTEDFVFESKVTGLLNNYTADYETLKKSLNIGSRDEFGFIFTYNNRTMLKTPEKNVTISVYASQMPIQYIKTNGEREAGTLTVLVW